MIGSGLRGTAIAALFAISMTGCGGGTGAAPRPTAPTPAPAPGPASTQGTCPEPVPEPGCAFADDYEACQRLEDAELRCLNDPACKARCYDAGLEGLRESMRNNHPERSEDTP